MHLCIHACIYIFMHLCMYLFMHFYTFMHLFNYFSIFMHLFNYFSIFMHLFTYFCIFMHLFVYFLCMYFFLSMQRGSTMKRLVVDNWCPDWFTIRASLNINEPLVKQQHYERTACYINGSVWWFKAWKWDMIYRFTLLCHYGKHIHFKNKSNVWRSESSCLRRSLLTTVIICWVSVNTAVRSQQIRILRYYWGNKDSMIWTDSSQMNKSWARERINKYKLELLYRESLACCSSFAKPNIFNRESVTFSSNHNSNTKCFVPWCFVVILWYCHGICPKQPWFSIEEHKVQNLRVIQPSW